MGIEDPNFWAAMLGGGIIGAIMSSLTTIFFGERRVEKLRSRREHSSKLMNDVLKPWLSKCSDHCKIGAVYSREVDRLVARKPEDPIDLSFFEFAKSHLNSKYPVIINERNNIKNRSRRSRAETSKRRGNGPQRILNQPTLRTVPPTSTGQSRDRPTITITNALSW